MDDRESCDFKLRTDGKATIVPIFLYVDVSRPRDDRELKTCLAERGLDE